MYRIRCIALLLTTVLLFSCFAGVTFVTAEETPAPYAFFEIDQTNGAVTVCADGYLRRKDNTVLTQAHMTKIPNGGGWGYCLTGEGEGFHLGGSFLTKVPDGQEAIVAIEYYIDGEPQGNMFRLGGGSVITQRDFNANGDQLLSRRNGVVFYTMTADKIRGKVTSGNPDTHIRVFGCENGANKVYIKSLKLIQPMYYQPFADDPGYEYYDLEQKRVPCPYYPNFSVADCSGMTTAWEGTNYRYFSVTRNLAPSETENRAVFIRLYTTKGYENTTVSLNQYQTYGEKGANFNGFNGFPNFSFYVQNGVGSVYIPAACFCNSLNALGSFRFGSGEDVKIARVEVYDVYSYCTSPEADPAVVAEMHRGALRQEVNVIAEGDGVATPENPSVTATYRCAFCGETIGQLSDSLTPTEVVYRLPQEPIADGVIDEAEWGLQDGFLVDYYTHTVPNGVRREELSGVRYYGWTDNAFCFAAEAQYATHRNSNVFQLMLNGHAICLTLTTDGAATATVDGALWQGAYAVRRTGNTTVYEAVIPKDLFGGTLKENGLIRLSYAFLMSNGYGYEWYGGLSHETVAIAVLGGDKAMSPIVTETRLTGNVDRLGTVDSTDARMTLQYSVQKIAPDDLDLQVADVNGDGAVDSTDARLILQYAVRKITVLPLGDTLTIPTGEVIVTDTRTYSSNTFSPNSKEAGTPFLSLGDVERKQAAPGAAEFAYFAFLKGDNEQLPFSFACYDGGDTLTAMVPAGVDLSAMMPTFEYYGEDVLLNGQIVRSDVTVLDLTRDVVLTLVPWEGASRTVTVHVETLDTGLPSVALTTENMQAITSKQTYVASTFYLGGGNMEEAMLVTSRAKGRGNSTWGHPKKSYTVKLNQKATLLGMSRSKDWVLSANYEDRSLLRNVAATYLAMGTGQAWTPDRQPVDLWYNGEYWGTYDLAEKIEIEGDRVDITEYEVGMKEGQYGFILEFDGHVAGGMDNCTRPLGEEIPLYYDPDTDELFMHTPVVAKWLTIKEPSYEDLVQDPAQMLYIYEYVCDALAALASGDYEAVEQYFDVQSFCEWYLVQALMNNTDSDFYSSCYLTRDAGGRLTMGPIWDFDRSSVNCYYWNSAEDITYLFHHGSTWFPLLFRYPQAQAILVAEYERFVPRIEGLRTYLRQMADSIYASQVYNFERWPLWGHVPNGPGANGEWNEQALEQLHAECFEAELARLNAFFLRHAARMEDFMEKLKITGV